MRIRFQRPHQAQGGTIKTARLSRGLSQRQLARAIGEVVGKRRAGIHGFPESRPYSREHISRLEHNLVCASGRVAKALETVLGVTVPLPCTLPDQHAVGREDIRRAREEIATRTAEARRKPRLEPFYIVRWS